MSRPFRSIAAMSSSYEAVIDRAPKVGEVVGPPRRERDGDLAAPDGPHHVDHCRMHSQRLRDGDDHRVLGIDRIVRRAVAVGLAGEPMGVSPPKSGKSPSRSAASRILWCMAGLIENNAIF